MPAPRPYTLVAELTYQCPLHCPYCSNPVDIGGERWRAQLETEHWTRVFREARAMGVVQLALTGGAMRDSGKRSTERVGAAAGTLRPPARLLPCTHAHITAVTAVTGVQWKTTAVLGCS